MLVHHESNRPVNPVSFMLDILGGLATLSQGMPWSQLLMPLSSAVALITAILCSGAFHRTKWGNYKLYKIVLLKLSPRLQNTLTYLRFAWSFIGSLLNITVFLRQHYLCSNSFIVVDIPQCMSFNSPKQFGNSFSFNAPIIWNDLSGEVCAVTSLIIQTQVKAHLFLKKVELELELLQT